MLKLSVLIVEDEALERETLVAQTREILPQHCEIWEAGNGIDALRICQEKQPELLFVDINIPGISGLVLVETLRDFAYSGKIIITTAYDEFAYIKKALTHGVINYLLKPIDEKELARTLSKCLSQLSAEQSVKASQQALQSRMVSAESYAQTYIVRDLLSGNVPENTLRSAFFWPPDGALQAQYLECVLKTDNDAQVTLFHETCERLFQNDFISLRATVDGSIVVLLQPRMPMDAACLTTLAYVHGNSLVSALESAGVSEIALYGSGIFETYKALQLSYDQTHRSMLAKAAGGRKHLAPPVDSSALCAIKQRKKLRQKWMQRLREGQVPYIVAMLKRALNKEGAYWPGVFLLLETFQQMNASPEALEEIVCIMRQEDAFTSLRKWLSRYYAACALPAQEMDHQSAIARKAFRMMQERFADDLAQSDLADEFGLSQAYFSRLFKKEMGVSFVTMLTKIRMQEAKRLLSAGDCIAHEVARQCGYMNGKYFQIAFKKEIGCTPAQYLQSLRAARSATIDA